MLPKGLKSHRGWVANPGRPSTLRIAKRTRLSAVTTKRCKKRIPVTAVNEVNVGTLVPLPTLWHFNGAGIGFPQRSCKARAGISQRFYPRRELVRLERYKKARASVESEKVKLEALRQRIQRWAGSPG